MLVSTVNGNVVVLSFERSDDIATQLWHMWLCHMSEKGMTILAGRGLLKGLRNCKLDFCENYVFGKQQRGKFDTTKHISKEILEYVHSDVWGPASVNSLGSLFSYSE